MSEVEHSSLTLEFRRGEFEPITFETIEDELTPDCKAMVEKTISLLEAAMSDKLYEICSGLNIKIGRNLTKSGGEALPEQNLIKLNYDKMAMSLQASEDLLVAKGDNDKGERTRTLPDIKDEPWSTLVYELVHEVAHIIDGKSLGTKHQRLEPALAPTKYGKKNSNEAFAEAFTYWVLEQIIDHEAEQIIWQTIGREWRLS